MGKMLCSIRDADDINLVGGKAFALSKMMRADFTVPDGFVITTQAFHKLTPEFTNHILENFDALKSEYVAVRSSAVSEDSADAAWAGQLDTFLNCTRQNLMENIQKCWQSVESERARSYATQKSLEFTKVAVLVQEMIQAEVSGVAFSVHPVTRTSAHVVIEAAYGLGEAIVSGQVTPDTYVVNKHSGLFEEKYISNQSKKLTIGQKGSIHWQELQDSGDAQKLRDALIVELTGTVTKLESFFGYPVDVEWALIENQIFILQSRPITALSDD